MTDKSKLSDIVRKIKALRARAADSASSENEAAKAAEVADRLLREHNLQADELDVCADGVELGKWGKTSTRAEAKYAASGIAAATGTKNWLSNGQVVFLGAPGDVEVALYLMDLVDNACGACLRTFKRTDAYAAACRWDSPRKVGNDFRVGVAARLGQRIKEQAEAAKAAEAAPTGTDLVVVKGALIQQWLADRGIRFKAGRGSRSVGDGYEHGKSAAEGVALTRGVRDNTASAARIGGY